MNDSKTGGEEPRQSKGNAKPYTIAFGIIYVIIGVGCFARMIALLMNGNHNSSFLFLNDPFQAGYFGTYAAAMAAALLLSVWKPVPCPVCKRKQRAPLSLPESYKPARSRFRFEVQPMEKCAACGNIWQPPTPVWMLLIGIILTLALFIKSSDYNRQSRLILFPFGLIIFAGCVYRLLRYHWLANKLRNSG